MSNSPASKLCYTLAEFARIIGVSYSTAKRMADTGSIKRVRLHPRGRLVVPSVEMDRLLRELGRSS